MSENVNVCCSPDWLSQTRATLSGSDVVPEVEVVRALELVRLQKTVLVVGLVDVSKIDVPHLQPFSTTAMNLHPSLEVAYMPWGLPES